jgi:hypothetical protein
MPGETKHGIECTEFETLLSDAAEGQLTGARKDRFEAHRRVCAVCGPLFADVQAGRQLLTALEEVEPPAHLVHNILAATTGVVSSRVLATMPETITTPLAERLREWWDSLFTPAAEFVRQPRFVMSFGMIFFCFSLIVNAAGVKRADIAKIDLHPKALRRAYNDAQVWVVQRYDNMRLVYEIESKVRELKRATQPAEPGTQPPKQNPKNNTSGQPDQKQDRNYSRSENQPLLAGLTNSGTGSEAASFRLRAASNHTLARSWSLVAPSSEGAPPVVAVTMNRRSV